MIRVEMGLACMGMFIRIIGMCVRTACKRTRQAKAYVYKTSMYERVSMHVRGMRLRMEDAAIKRMSSDMVDRVTRNR